MLFIDLYKQSMKRIITEPEIGYAAAQKTIEKHCNPFYSFEDALFPPKMVSQTQRSSTSEAEKIVVPETQDIISSETDTSLNSTGVVDETFVGTGAVSVTPTPTSTPGPGPSNPSSCDVKCEVSPNAASICDETCDPNAVNSAVTANSRGQKRPLNSPPAESSRKRLAS